MDYKKFEYYPKCNLTSSILSKNNCFDLSKYSNIDSSNTF